MVLSPMMSEVSVMFVGCTMSTAVWNEAKRMDVAARQVSGYDAQRWRREGGRRRRECREGIEDGQVVQRPEARWSCILLRAQNVSRKAAPGMIDMTDMTNLT